MGLYLVIHRSETVRELETQLSEAETKKAELDSKMVTLTALKEGKVPEAQPSAIPEPIIKTVEVGHLASY